MPVITATYQPGRRGPGPGDFVAAATLFSLDGEPAWRSDLIVGLVEEHGFTWDDAEWVARTTWDDAQARPGKTLRYLVRADATGTALIPV